MAWIGNGAWFSRRDRFVTQREVWCSQNPLQNGVLNGTSLFQNVVSSPGSYCCIWIGLARVYGGETLFLSSTLVHDVDGRNDSDASLLLAGLSWNVLIGSRRHGTIEAESILHRGPGTAEAELTRRPQHHRSARSIFVQVTVTSKL